MSESRVLPSGHELVRRALRDFRVAENGQSWVARLKGEGRFRSSVFPEAREPHVLVELIPLREWTRPGLLTRWFAALRLPYLAISLLPLLLVLCARAQTGAAVPAALTLLLFASVTLIHLGCNLWSDYEDHVRGVDSPGQSGGSGVIQKLWIPAVHLRNTAAAFFVAGCLLGLLLLAILPAGLLSQRLLWLALLGAVGAASYSGWPFHYKYLGLGEPIVFLLSGPVVAMGAASLYFENTAEITRLALLSLPLAFAVTLRLHCGNMQRIPFDTIARVRTIARACGFAWSKHACAFLALAPFLSLSALVALGALPAWSLASWLAFPFALQALRSLPGLRGPLDPLGHELRLAAQRLHIAFGLLYCLSLLLTRP